MNKKLSRTLIKYSLIVILGFSANAFAAKKITLTPEEVQRLYGDGMKSNLASTIIGTQIREIQEKGEKPEKGTSLSMDDQDQGKGTHGLLCEDRSIGYEIKKKGLTSFVFSFDREETLKRINFHRENMKGKVSVYGSDKDHGKDLKAWGKPLGKNSIRFSNSNVIVRLGSAKAKFVRIDFDLEKAGSVFGFGIYGDSHKEQYEIDLKNNDFAKREVSSSDASAIISNDRFYYDLGDKYNPNRRLSYVSSGAGIYDSPLMVDDDTDSYYYFSNRADSKTISEEVVPEWVLDLGGEYDVSRISTIYTKGHTGNLEVYIVPSAPHEDIIPPTGQTLAHSSYQLYNSLLGSNAKFLAAREVSPSLFNAANADSSTPTLSSKKEFWGDPISVIPGKGNGRASLDLPHPVKVRYLGFRWIKTPGTKVTTPFGVAVISAFDFRIQERDCYSRRVPVVPGATRGGVAGTGESGLGGGGEAAKNTGEPPTPSETISVGNKAPVDSHTVSLPPTLPLSY